ncbi:ABC transporter ATP-binding protein [Trinickia caryophylli]|uniref:ATP-binding cassette, subfamily B n=2 Tax=Trinickia caryophylli TaxID=28094 RepID=A0A1X7CG95_TRICW|nr:ABC transporter ATP-binding protein [Trinickia caryophylli]SME95793.1 ATP-binding cassette, subfamily B [Trinickia caryophylli]
MPATVFLARLGDALRLLRRASPSAFHGAVAANLLGGLVPAALVYAGARLVEQLAAGRPLAAVAALLALYVLLNGFQECLTSVTGFVLDTLRDRVRMTMKADVSRAVATFPTLVVHEDAALRETAVLAAKAGDDLGDLVDHLHAVFLGVVTIVPVVALTGAIAWWMPAVMLAGTIPAMILRARAERASWDVQAHHASTFNALRIFERVLMQPEFAKDLRIYRMHDRLLERWRARYETYLSQATHVRARNAWRLAAAAVVTSACLALPLFAIARGFASGRHGVADLVVFFGALTQLRDGLAAVVYNLGDLLGVSYAIEPYRTLLARRAEAGSRISGTSDIPHAPAAADRATLPDNAELVLRDVTFRYGNASEPALEHIDLDLRRGETVAIVGENGAGKTSLMKLVCGLYAPSSGAMTWRARHEAGDNARRKAPRVVAVFQDFARFPLTPVDNLALPAGAGAHDERVAAPLRAVGLDSLVSKTDMPLTSEIEGGADLSGGQWQRLAIARALAHAAEANLFVFDEPTSALDPESEAQIMHRILETVRGKTALIVSHRLALTRFVDRIVVLEHGRIVEQGSHDALMAKQGRYARMFAAQAQFYR